MTFLNPFLLAGLAAVAIPVIVHLFHFRRPRRLDLPTLRFLRAVEATAVRRMRLRQWLLLALRVAAVALLALAFARPTRTADADGLFADRGARSLAVVVDNSRSMTLRDADGALLDQARQIAEAVIEATGPGDERTVLPTAAPPDVQPVPFTSSGPALDVLAALQPAPRASALTAAIARAGSGLSAAVHPRREIVVVSDLQASTFTDSARVDLPPDVSLVLMPLAARAEPNTAVTAVRVASTVVAPGQPVRIEATVARFGGRAGRVAATLSLGGTRVAEASVQAIPGRPATVVFTATPRAGGWSGGEVRIAPVAGESAVWDDARVFALHVPPPPRVLVVRGDGARADRLLLALGVAAESGGLALTETAEGALGGTDLSRTDVVVLVGPTGGSAGASARLAAFVQRGGGVLAFPGDAPEALNSTLAALGGGRIAGTVGTRGGPSIGGLASTDLRHPIFAGLFDTPTPTVESPDVRLAARYTPGRGDEQTVMQLSAGPPLLHEIRRGAGRTLLFGVAADPAWSDLTERSLFVPLVVRSVAYLASGAALGDAAAPDGVRSVRVETDASGLLRLVGPGDRVVAAEQRAVAGGVVLSLDAATETGLYRVMQGERLLRTVAVNEAARESDPALLDPDEAARRLEALTGRPVRLVEARGGAGLAAASGTGTPLWTWALALALIALVAETAVASRRRTDGV
ncbi:MAG TPA: BatA domain-containing protein [Rubricoccaceae bacterium]|jgi:hypothetical protein